MGVVHRLASISSLCLLLELTKCQSHLDDIGNGVENLVSIPDFRSVKLKWSYFSDHDPLGFFITLCEVFKSRDGCFERHLLNRKPKTLLGHDSLWTDGRGHYEAVIHDLRMLTNYTVKVEPMAGNLLSSPRRQKGKQRVALHHQYSDANILFATKGFSAHATNCRANSSDIVVHTGPYFGGKIAVEGSSDERCSVYGNRTSKQEVYILRIDHRLCSSTTVNNSRIDTIVIVHESSRVVTHNSRRFLVQCTFLPETFTIKASFSVPPEESKRNLNYKDLEDALKSIDSNDVFTYEHYKQNHVKDSRMSSVQGPSVLQQDLPGVESQMLVLLVVVIILAILVVIVIGLGLWWYVNSHRRRSNNVDIETLSTSGSSIIAYQHGTNEGDDDTLVRRAATTNGIFNDPYGYYHARNMNPFCAGQVALVSLKPVKELY